MIKYRITCPDCGAAIITATRLTAVWELCPSCRRHILDVYDALLADAYFTESGAAASPGMTA